MSEALLGFPIARVSDRSHHTLVVRESVQTELSKHQLIT